MCVCVCVCVCVHVCVCVCVHVCVCLCRAHTLANETMHHPLGTTPKISVGLVQFPMDLEVSHYNYIYD